MSLEARLSHIHGTGLFTTDSIRRHAVISPMKIIRKITPEQQLYSESESVEHCAVYEDGRQVLFSAPYRYANHSCRANAFVYTVEEVSYLFAREDIPADGEITIDYSLCNFDGPQFNCTCGDKECRGNHKQGFSSRPPEWQLENLLYLDPVLVANHTLEINELLHNFFEKK